MSPRSLTETPALLTVHSTSAGQYVIRIHDAALRPLVTGVAKLLPDASSLVLITPTDTKVFTLGNGQPSPASMVAESDNEMPPSAEGPPVTDPETLAAIAREERSSVPQAVTEEPESADVEMAPRTRRRKKQDSVSGHPEQCGRCRGSGRIQMLLEGGQSGDTACPVCHGEGTLLRYGVRR